MGWFTLEVSISIGINVSIRKMCEPGLHKHNHKDGNWAGVVHLSGIKDGGLRFLVRGFR